MNIGTWILTDSQGKVLPVKDTLDLAATGLNEVIQNVWIICNTRVGEVWGDRRFGLSGQFIDAPQNKAQLIIVQEICAGLTHFEPRASFANISFSPNSSNPGEMDVTLSVNLNISELVNG
jgi:phage baseplate assembly protein W